MWTETSSTFLSVPFTSLINRLSVDSAPPAPVLPPLFMLIKSGESEQELPVENVRTKPVTSVGHRTIDG